MSTILTRIKPLVGHAFIYQTRNIEIIDWRIDGDELTLKTDSTPIKLHVAHVKEFLTELMPNSAGAQDALNGIEQPRQESLPARAQVNAIVQMLPTTALSEINNALLDSIRKVQTDANYIPQAKAISDAVQVAVNVSKLQIEAAKLSMQAQRRGK